MKRLLLALLFVIFMTNEVMADTISQDFGSSKYEDITIYLPSGGSVCHTFLIDGVFGNSFNSFRTDWYSTQDIQGTVGFIESDSSNAGNVYYDPSIQRTYSSSGTYYARGEVMTRDYVWQDFWWKETHQWRIVVVVDTTGPNSPGTPDLDSSDDTGKSNTDNITKNKSNLTFSWSASSGDAGIGLKGYQWKLGSGSWTDNGTSLSKSINVSSDGDYTFYVRAIDDYDNPSTVNSLPFSVDSTRPNMPSLSLTEPPYETTDTIPYFNWSGSDNSGGSGIWRYHLLIEYAASGLNQIDELPENSYYQTPSSQALSAGGQGYDWEVWAIDVAGNESSGSGEDRFYINDTVGSVCVTIEPASAVSAGACWKLTQSGYDSGWKTSSTTLSDVPTGNYTITFSEPSGWGSPSGVPPSAINVSVGEGANVSRTGIYKRITSAYWWDPIEVDEGTIATMCAEVEGYDVGTEFTFELFEEDGILGRDPVSPSMTGSVYESGGKYYVKAEWPTVWQADQLDDPEFEFDISNGDTKKTSRNKLVVRKVAQITEFVVPTGSYAPGTEQEIKVTIKNTGTSARKFWVGLSLAGPQTEIDNWPAGWLDIAPQQVPLAGEPNLACDGTATVTFRFTLNEWLPDGQYTAYVAVWNGFDSDARQFPQDPQPDEETYSVNGLMLPPKFAGENKQTFYIDSSLISDDRYNIMGNDPGGLLKEIPIKHRNANLYNLPINLSSTLQDAYDQALSPSNQNILVLFHGWNGFDTVSDAYNQGAWANIKENLLSKLPNNWRLVPYHWEKDADTGGFIPRRDATRPQAITSKSVQTLSTSDRETQSVSLITIGYLAYVAIETTEHLVTANTTVCAYRSYMHGLALGKRLCTDIGKTNIKKVHLMSSSAGAWAAYAALRYLHQNAPGVELQVTYLDPFIPGNIIGSIDCFGGISAGLKFNKNILASTPNYALVNTPGTFKTDCYWSLNDLETYWSAKVVGAFQDWLGDAVLPPQLNTIVNLISGDLSDSTVVDWTWDGVPDTLVYNTDDTGNALYISHSGPIRFYADSVLDLDESPFSGKAWQKSLAANADSDSDGMLDTWERTHFGDLSHNGTADSDSDCLNDLQEYQNDTDPNDSDSDDDGITDGWEVTYGLNPLFDDANNDPDGDGYTNIEEYEAGTNPKSPASHPGLGDVNGDRKITVLDAILALQITCGMDTSGTGLSSNADVNGDGKIGIEEVIYILQKVAGLRSD